MLIEKIEALRKKPKAVRNRYAFSIALSTTLLIAIVWAVGVPARFDRVVMVNEETNNNREEVSEQLMQLRELVADSVSDIKTQAELVGTAINSSTTQEFIAEMSSTTLSLVASSTATTTATTTQ